MPSTQVSDGNSDGTTVGQSTTDMVSLYGVTPVVQATAITAVNGSSTIGDMTTAITSLIAAAKAFGITA